MWCKPWLGKRRKEGGRRAALVDGARCRCIARRRPGISGRHFPGPERRVPSLVLFGRGGGWMELAWKPSMVQFLGSFRKKKQRETCPYLSEGKNHLIPAAVAGRDST